MATKKTDAAMKTATKKPATKKADAAVKPAAEEKPSAKKPAVKTVAQKEAAVQDKLATIRAEVEQLVAEYNESADFAEFKRMKKLADDMGKKVAEYTEEAEGQCFRALRVKKDPMIAAIKQMTFKTIAVRDEKLEGGGTRKIVDDKNRFIDLYRLHKTVDGGIGADKFWWSYVERLNMLFTAATAYELNAISNTGDKLDLAKIRDTIAMSEEARKLTMKGEDKAANDKVMLENVQMVMDAMIGEGYTATAKMVSYLRRVHEKAGKDKLKLVASRAASMRLYMMNVCYAAITGEDFVLEYKVKKDK